MRSKTLLLALCCSAVLGCLGLALSMPAGRPASVPPPSTECAGSSELRSALQKFSAQLEELPDIVLSAARERLQRSDPGEGEPRPDTRTTTSSAALLAALEDLNRRLDQHEARANAPSPDSLRAGVRRPAQSRALELTWEANAEERALSHQFLSYAEILERYGPPDSMYVAPEGSLVWLYTDTSNPGQLGFTFFDGFVVQAWGGRLQEESVP